MLPLINNLFDSLDKIIEFENIFNAKFNNTNLVKNTITDYIDKNNIESNNIDAVISYIQKDIEDNKNSPIVQKALLSELVLLNELKKSNLEINQVDQKYQKTFLTTQFNLFLPNYINNITQTIDTNQSPSTSNLIPTVEELEQDDNFNIVDSNEAPTINKTEILQKNLKKFNLTFDFSDEEKNQIIQTIDNIQNNILNFNAQVKENIGVVRIMTKIASDRTIGIVGDGLIKDIGKFSNGNPFSPENIKTIFEYINIAKEIIINANNETIKKYNNEIKKQNKEAKKKNKNAIEKPLIKEIEKKDLFPIILKKLNDFSEKIKLYDADAISLNSLKTLIENIIEYETSKTKNKDKIANKMIENIAIIFKVIRKNFIIPGVLSFLGESIKKNDNAATVGDLLQTLYPNENFTNLLTATSNINNSNNNLFEETASNNEDETQKQSLIQELQNELKTKEQNNNKKVNQELANENQELEKTKQTLQEELDQLKQKLADTKKRRASISSSNNSDSGIEDDNLQSSAIQKDDDSDNTFNNNLEEDKNDLPDFFKDKCDLKELRGTNQELTDKITLLTAQLEKLQSNDQKSQHEITELKMNLQNTENDLEKLQKIIDKPKTTIETQTEQKLSILKQIMQFFSELLESLSKELTSIGKGISSKLSEFNCFKGQTQTI